MSEPVAMLDLATRRLHRPSSEHLVAACGLVLDCGVTVGPLSNLLLRNRSTCVECWGAASFLLEP